MNDIKKFPLYNILYNHVKNNDKLVSKKDKKTFISFVEENENIHEVIYTIIRIYDLKTNKKKTSEIYNIPYKGTKIKQLDLENINFNIDYLPIYLQKMLIHFMNINKSED